MSEAPLSVERAGGAAWCTLDRPPLNLLEPGLIHAVRATFEALAADRVTRVAILTGGGRAFTAGLGPAAVRPPPGEPITAERARGGGPVNDVVPVERLRATVQALVDRILACGPEAIRLQKELIVRWRATDLATAVRYGINAFAAAYATDEPYQGMSAFLEKRAPKFGSSR